LIPQCTYRTVRVFQGNGLIVHLCCVANRLTAHHDRIRHTIFRGSRGQKVDICTGLIHRLCRNVASRLSTNQVRHHFHLCCCFSSGYIGECRSCHTHRHRQFIFF